MWHAKFPLMASPRAILGVLNKIFSGSYVNKIKQKNRDAVLYEIVYTFQL